MFPDFTSAPTLLAAAAVLGYLFGSIPFGLVIARVCGLGDLRQIGSGNIGATNVLRTGNKPAAAATLVLDSGKGAIAVLIARFAIGPDAAQIAGLAAFFGHCFPIWLKFNGGKGVATYLGTMLALFWPAGIACCLSWLVTAKTLKISSLSALVAAALGPIWAYVLGAPQLVGLAIALAVLIYYRHAANISRLMGGTEPKIGQK